MAWRGLAFTFPPLFFSVQLFGKLSHLTTMDEQQQVPAPQLPAEAPNANLAFRSHTVLIMQVTHTRLTLSAEPGKRAS